jgi:phosphatidylglycerophosphate synthase
MMRATFRHFPNAISACRLLAMPVLLMFALQRRPEPFAWLLLAALVSDIADGLIARSFHLESTLGAALDTTADFLVCVIAAIGMITLQPAFVAGHAALLIILAALYVGEVVVSVWRYGRLSSFHTYTTRIWAYAQGTFFVWLFFWGYNAWLFYTAWILGVASHVEEFFLLAALPQWTHDVRGLYWVWKVRAH